MNQEPQYVLDPEEVARTQGKAERWRVCQQIGVDIYKSQVKNGDLGALRSRISTLMRSGEATGLRSNTPKEK